MDLARLPLPLLIALGLAPEGCTSEKPKERLHPCLKFHIDGDDHGVRDPSAATRPDEKAPADPDDPPVGACLKVAEPDDPPVGACLKVAVPDPPAHPCLSVPMDTKRPAPDTEKKAPPPAGATARNDVIERVRSTLPEDVAARLRERGGSA